jgi:hypothetical protein
MKKNNSFTKLIFTSVNVTELNEKQAEKIIGGTEDLPNQTFWQTLTQITK